MREIIFYAGIVPLALFLAIPALALLVNPSPTRDGSIIWIFVAGVASWIMWVDAAVFWTILIR